MPIEKIKRLWNELDSGFNLSLKGQHTGKVVLRTVDGADEALFGLISANFLLGGVQLSEIREILTNPVGVLDLGGSSLEVSIAGYDHILGTHDDVLVSFKSLGMSQGRLAVASMDESGKCQFGTV